MIYFILIIIIILTLAVTKKENFTCKINPILIPLSVKNLRDNNNKGFIIRENKSYINTNSIDKYKHIHKVKKQYSEDNYIDTNLVVSGKNITKILKSIKTIPPKYKYIEKKTFNNNYYNFIGDNFDNNYVQNLIDKLSNYLEKIILEKSNKLYYKYCNKFTNCTLKRQSSKIKLIGKGKNNKTMIEGQLLYKFNISSYSFLIDYVISDENKFTIHYLKLSGIALINFKGYKPDFNYLNKTNYKIITNEVKNFNKPNRSPDSIYKFSYSCYGRKALDKANCENLYFKDQKYKSQIGVWDKKCEKDEECPYYRANKNYDNNLGGCNNGYCQFPIGAIRISPRKIKEESVLKCHNCKKGFDCCEQQKDIKLYPKLKSPDYMFLGDNVLRNL